MKLSGRNGATLVSALAQFVLALLVFLSLRWILIEPYVIPSGSMIPTLAINDHILVSKFDYGIRIPFTQDWLTGPYLPKRGDIVVFQSVENPEIVMIKRVVGLPGDKINISVAEFNRFPIVLEKTATDTTAPEDGPGIITVPEGHLYMMGDNRNNSRDSRFWGPLPIENLLGKARRIWLACEKTISRESSFCDFKTLNKKRMFTQIE
jgi:signal peptidase I